MKKFALLLSMFFLGAFFYSCKKDAADPVVEYTDVDKVTMSLVVNGKSSTEILVRDEVLQYVTDVLFPSTNSTWESPSVEMTLADVLVTSKDDVRVIRGNADFTAARVTVADGKVRVTFDPQNGSFDYLTSNVIRISVTARVADAVTYDDLEAYRDSGFACSSRFVDHGKSSTPVTALVYSRVGDPELLLGGVQIKFGNMQINNSASSTMTERDDMVIYSTTVTTNALAAKWTMPTFEQTFNEMLYVLKDRVTVSDTHGYEVPVEATVSGNKLTVTFSSVNGKYDHLVSRGLTIKVSTMVKGGVKTSTLDGFKTEGFTSTCVFYGNDPSLNVTNTSPAVNTNIAPYTLVGDPYPYPYKLNVVCFVPLNITPNPHYVRRLSNMLLTFQNWLCDWTEYWGYGRRSFGLPLREDGMVDIVTVFGKEIKSHYPYSSATGGSRMLNEVREYYNANGGLYSQHYLVLGVANSLVNVDYPFYGMGTWAFAVDFPDMDENLYTYQRSALPGGLMHEAGHGALNLPHVGPSSSQQSDSRFGMTLMGAGNMTYGQTPTFFHKTSAAYMITGQLSALSEGTFYSGASGTVAPPTMTIEGNNCTVSGTFTTNKGVNDVVVRFYKANETFLGGSSGYTSVAYAATVSGNSYTSTMPLSDLKILIDNNTSSKEIKLGVTILHKNCQQHSYSPASVYTLTDRGGGNFTLDSDEIDKTGWTVTASQNPLTADYDNRTSNLVDNNAISFLSLVKPGMSYGGVSVPLGAELWFSVDMQKSVVFDKIRLMYRTESGEVKLRAERVSFYSSNDNVTWTPLKTAVDLTTNNTINVITVPTGTTCRYLKMTYDKWETQDRSAATLGFSELSLLRN